MLAGWATTLADPRQRRLLRRLYNSVDDEPHLAETYQEMFGRHRDRALREVLAKAQRDGLLPDTSDPGTLLDILTGAAGNTDQPSGHLHASRGRALPPCGACPSRIPVKSAESSAKQSTDNISRRPKPTRT